METQDLNLLRWGIRGYDTLYAFFAGFETEEEDNFIGWNGIERKHPFELLEEIISVRNRSSLIESSTFITYVGDDFSVDENAERIIYPNGRCFSLPLPETMEMAMSLEVVLNNSHRIK